MQAEWFISPVFKDMVELVENRERKNYRKEAYYETRKGKIDQAVLSVAIQLRDFWREFENEPVSYASIERKIAERNNSVSPYVAGAVLKLRDIGMIKLAMKGTVISPGENWAENDAPHA